MLADVSVGLFFLTLCPHLLRCVMSGADVEVYLSQVHDGSVSSGFRALYEERLLLDVTLLIEEHHFQVPTTRSTETQGLPLHLKPTKRELINQTGPTAGVYQRLGRRVGQNSYLTMRGSKNAHKNIIFSENLRFLMFDFKLMFMKTLFGESAKQYQFRV